ncbi:MFS transporter [Nanoarchaeota archaeon]
MKRLNIDYIVYIIVYFIQGSLALTSIALPFFLKDIIGLTTAQVTYLMAAASIPWVLKPLYGMISDFFPIKGLKRKPYILIASLIASLSWIVFAETNWFWILVIAKVTANIGFASMDVFTDGLAVQKSTDKNRGIIQSVCWGSRSAGSLLTGFTGAYLINIIGYQGVFRVMAVLPLFVILALVFVKEKHEKTKPVLKNFKALFISLLKNNQFLLAAGFIFLLFIAPSISTPFLFYMRETLGFTNSTIGLIMSISSLGALLGAIVYGRFLDKYSLKKLLRVMIVLGALFTFTIFLIVNEVTAYIVFFANSFLFYIIFIPVLKLSAKVCPKGFEATSFAVLMSLTNLSNQVLSQAIGGYLYSLMGITPVVFISAITSLLALPLVKYFKE